MPAYDVLAADYDAVTGDVAAEAALVRKIIERRHGRAATLLDVACGTGAVTAELARAYRVSGLDISPGMLGVARAKLPGGTPLYLADMASFELTARFDAIVCAYQGVNHLPGFPAWESFFRRAARHLNSRGVFVFDIATVGYLEAMASVPRVVQRFGDDYLVIRVSMTGRLASSWQLEVFKRQPDGSYRLVTQTLAMTAFPLAQIRDALERTFTDVEAVDAAGEPAGEDAGRVWLACGKRA
jgi:SAM-dependent methyltransferase